MESIKEAFADIRNKLQPGVTVLEGILAKKNPPENLIKAAIGSLALVVSSLNSIEDDYRKKKVKKSIFMALGFGVIGFGLIFDVGAKIRWAVGGIFVLFAIIVLFGLFYKNFLRNRLGKGLK